MRLSLFLLSTVLLLSACARIETPEDAQRNAREAQERYDRLATQQRAENGDEEGDLVGSNSPGQIDTSGSGRLTPGSWSVATDGEERMARFGEDGETPRITIACEVGGGIDIRLVNMQPQGGSETVYISSPEGASTFTASDTVGGAVEGYISVPASDPFVGRLISGNGPFSLRMGSDQRIIFPGDDVLTSVVSACDRGRGDRVTIEGTTDTQTTGETPATPPEGTAQ